MFRHGFRSILACWTALPLRRSSLISIALISLSGLLLAACSLASPAPVNVDGMGSGSAAAPFAQGNSTPQPVELPSRRPSATEGAKYYAEKCVRCHGLQGRGNGEMAAQIQSQFGRPVADLTSDVVARAQAPEVWYSVITNGSLQTGMPPFASLTVDQRWDVIAYLWTLAAPQVQIDTGKEVYLKQSVQCHGDTGKGDGKDAQGTLPDLTQFATLAPIEAGRWDQALASTHIPSFAGTTSELERRASIDYIRTFAYDYAAPGSTSTAAAASTPAAASTNGTPVPNANATPAPAGTGEAITVEGYLVNGTASQPVPGNLPITFYIFPGGTGDTSITHTYQTDAAGHFVITTTEAKTGDLIAATTEYKQLNFFSNLENYAPRVTVPITIYESTADASQVKVDTLHVVAMPDANGGLSVSEIYVLSNNGDKIVAGFGQPVMHFNLPKNIQSFSVDQNMRADTVVQNGDGFEFFDAIPVGTNAAQIIVQYAVPAGPFALDRTLTYNVGSVNLLVEGDATQAIVNSSQLVASGTQDISGKTYQQFTAANLAAGANLVVTIGGAATPVNWTAIAGAALVVIGLGGVFVWQRSRSKSAPVGDTSAQQDALIDQIAALDDEFAAGQIDEVNYKAKRAKLKERLLKIMSTE